MSPDKRLEKMEFNGTFLVTIVSFLIFVFLMNKILYAPVLNIMEERKNFVEGNYKEASDNDSKSEALANEREEKLIGARDEARGKYAEALDDFKLKKADIIQNAQNSANEELERAKNELANLSNEVKEGLKNRMTDLANDIVEKVLGYRSEVSGFDNDKVNEVLYH